MKLKNKGAEERRPHGHEKPWVTGFLLHQLIRYIQKNFPKKKQALNFSEILNTSNGFETIRDAESFLTDPNHWLPQEVLNKLLKKCEEISGDPEVAYHAALNHFQSMEGKKFSALERIAELMGDIRLTFICSPLWASAYATQFLKLQPFHIQDAPNSIGLIAQFQSQVKPRWSNHLLLKGNCEGFGKLYDFIETVECHEEFTQVRLEELILDYENYEIKTQGNTKIIFEKKSKKPVIEAQAIPLEPKPVPSLKETEDFPQDLMILPSLNGWLRPLSPQESKNPEIKEGILAYQIKSDGTLQRDGLHLKLKKGQIFGAPYSRFTFHWKKHPSSHDAPREVSLKKVSQFLFDHLKDMRSYQKKMLRMVMENNQLSTQNRTLKNEITQSTRFMGFIGKSRSMRKVYSLIQAVAHTDATVLITGETGTGKELVARALHDLGPRAQHRFLGLSCNALSENLMESELFGHERGAFTGAVTRRKGKFELAQGGTLFLDEIGDISPALQVKLLRVLQERSFQRVGGSEDIHMDVRIIAATNQDLDALIKQGKFRKDLFYRLHLIPIHLPPLRDREGDILLLVEHFIQKTKLKHKHHIERITPDALQCLSAYSWPGNVRELEYAIERSVILSGEYTALSKDLLPEEFTRQDSQNDTALGDLINQLEWNHISQYINKKGTMESAVNLFEWRIVQQAIEGHKGNKSQAARALNRTYRWLRKLEQKQEKDGNLPL